MKDWDRLVDELIQNQKARGLVAATIAHREREIIRFGTWLRRKKKISKYEDIKIETIHEYIKSRGTFLSKSSVCGLIGPIRLFGDHLVERGYWVQNPLRWITGPKLNNTRKIPKTYHRKDLEKIFEESFNSSGIYFRALFPAIISLFYSTGIRKSELLALDISDWNSEESCLRVFSSKTSLGRVIPIPEITKKCLENYLSKRQNLLLKKNIDTPAFFVNREGSRVDGTQLLVQFKRIAKRANVSKATIHMFRHSCATGLIEEGVPLPQVQRFLGHASTASTFRYLDVANPERKKAMLKHPISTILNNLKELENEK